MLGPSIHYRMSLNVVGSTHLQLPADGHAHLFRLNRRMRSVEGNELLSACSLELPAFRSACVSRCFLCLFDWHLFCVSQHTWLSSSPSRWYVVEGDPCGWGGRIIPSAGTVMVKLLNFLYCFYFVWNIILSWPTWSLRLFRLMLWFLSPCPTEASLLPHPPSPKFLWKGTYTLLMCSQSVILLHNASAAEWMYAWGVFLFSQFSLSPFIFFLLEVKYFWYWLNWKRKLQPIDLVGVRSPDEANFFSAVKLSLRLYYILFKFNLWNIIEIWKGLQCLELSKKEKFMAPNKNKQDQKILHVLPASHRNSNFFSLLNNLKEKLEKHKLEGLPLIYFPE